MKRSTAIAYPTIPILLLGGLKNAEKRIPFYSTIGLAVTDVDEKVRTETTVELSKSHQKIELFVNGEKATGKRGNDMKKIADLLRKKANKKVGMNIYSTNYDIITGSSDSGAAALSLAVMDALELSIDKDELADIARLGSESVYRSLVGGLSLTKVEGLKCNATQLASPEQLKDFVIYAIPFSGTRHSADEIHNKIVKHPEFSDRVKNMDEKVNQIKKALKENNLIRIMQIAEEDAMNFHYLLEWVGVRVIKDPMYEATNYVRELREIGYKVYFTVAGGNMVYVYSTREESEEFQFLKGFLFRTLRYKVAGGSFLS